MKIHLMIMCIFFLSCNSDQKYNIKTYQIDINNLSHYDDMFENYHLVKLETTNDNIIRKIDKIEFYKKDIFILDKGNNAVFIFDSIGNYINQVSCLGKGHGEYLSADDFQIFDDNIYILSRVNKKIYRYNSNCDFIKDITLDDWYSNFYILNDKQMYLYSEESNEKKYNFILYDYVNNLYLKKFDKFGENQNLCFLKTPFNKIMNEDIFITKQFSNIIYSLSDNNYKPLYQLEYNTNDKISAKRYIKMSKIDLYNKLNTSSIVKRISGIDMANSNIYIYYDIMLEDIGYRTFVSIINDNNGEIKTCRLGDEINSEFPIMGEIISLSKNYLVSYLPAFVAMDIDTNQKLGMFKNENIKEVDNPILFFYKILK